MRPGNSDAEVEVEAEARCYEAEAKAGQRCRKSYKNTV